MSALDVVALILISTIGAGAAVHWWAVGAYGDYRKGRQ